MSQELENYYLRQPEPIQGCLLALKNVILGVDNQISHERKYQIPFFYFKGKKLCFLWVNKKKLLMGFIVDKNIYPVVAGIKRKDDFETMQIDPNADLPVKIILEKLLQRMKLYESG
ncbi:MAG TPA: hypothetical protein VFC67_18770 [Prolixibacteraceae bacterium]|nr:hypothetical protein [Prolixibacteraceae bacterium]